MSLQLPRLSGLIIKVPLRWPKIRNFTNVPSISIQIPLDSRGHWARCTLAQIPSHLVHSCGRSYETSPTKAVSAFPGDDGYGLIMEGLEWQTWNSGNRGEGRRPTVPERECQRIMHACCFFLWGPDAVGFSDGLGMCTAEHRRHTLSTKIFTYMDAPLFFSLLSFSLNDMMYETT